MSPDIEASGRETANLRLTPEDREAVAQLVRSPGWYVVMRDILLPRIQANTSRIEAPHASRDMSVTDVYRGLKLADTSLIQTLYSVADLPNPLQRYYQALLTTLQGYSGVETPDSSGGDTPVHWILNGRGLCGAGGGGAAIRGAAESGEVTCGICTEHLASMPTRSSRASTPV